MELTDFKTDPLIAIFMPEIDQIKVRLVEMQPEMAVMLTAALVRRMSATHGLTPDEFLEQVGALMPSIPQFGVATIPHEGKVQ